MINIFVKSIEFKEKANIFEKKLVYMNIFIIDDDNKKCALPNCTKEASTVFTITKLVAQQDFV